MLIVGILIILIASLMVIFPEFFMKLKSPRIPDKVLKNPKFRIVIRIWGCICTVIGIILIVFSVI